jgi:hypothetical protein
MDSTRFDHLTAMLSAPSGRRGVLAAILALLVGRGFADAQERNYPFGKQKGNGKKCEWDGDCKSLRCQGKTCKQGRTEVGASCTWNQECGSNVCGKFTSSSSVCRPKRCIQQGKDCDWPYGAWSCCAGICGSDTGTCVRSWDAGTTAAVEPS